jgi:FkbM family methyltransferase
MFAAFLRKLLGLIGPLTGETCARVGQANSESTRAIAKQPGGDSNDESTAMVAYDEKLLDHSRTQWQFGDWASLAKLDRDTLQHHPDRAKLALLCAAGHQAEGRVVDARKYTQLALDWGCSKRMVSQILVAGVYGTHGRAALAAGDSQRALGYFKSKVAVANLRVNSALLSETQIMRETQRLTQSLQVAATLVSISVQELQTPAKPDVGITSYAQNFEDVMLWRALGRIENGFYIDVGAHDPIIDSVSKAFYEHGWRGIHVEPLAEYADALRKDRPDERVIEAIIASEVGSQTFFHIPKTGLSTGTQEFATRHKNSGWQVNEIFVLTTTLEAVFDEIGDRQIHWLKIDVEGMEVDVLTGWGKHPARPWIVVVEATEPNSQTPTWALWEKFLTDRNYTFEYFDGLNRFYVAGEHQELACMLMTPPCIFDKFFKF